MRQPVRLDTLQGVQNADWLDVQGAENVLLIKKNSMVWVRERTTPTERPPLVGEVNANFCG
jgi:hypothetical protein